MRNIYGEGEIMKGRWCRGRR